MGIERWSPADTAVTHGIYAALHAMQAADDPAGPPTSAHRARMWFEDTWPPSELWFARDEDAGVVAGFYRVELPQHENRERASVLLCVHPRYRRRRTGTALLRHLAERAAVNERTVLGTFLAQGTPGEAFARRAGATAGLVVTRSVLHIGEQVYRAAADLRKRAGKHAAGYSLVSWSGPAPDEHLDQLAGIHNAMNDAPRGEGVEEQNWDAARVRRETDRLEALGSRTYEVAAIHDATGEMVAFTQLEFDPEVPEWGNQGSTVVTRSHRGHRLGLLVKTAMLDRLAVAEPGLRHIVTGNADSNEHMIAINEVLGFQILLPRWQGYDLATATATGTGTGTGTALG